MLHILKSIINKLACLSWWVQVWVCQECKIKSYIFCVWIIFMCVLFSCSPMMWICRLLQCCPNCPSSLIPTSTSSCWTPTSTWPLGAAPSSPSLSGWVLSPLVGVILTSAWFFLSLGVASPYESCLYRSPHSISGLTLTSSRFIAFPAPNKHKQLFHKSFQSSNFLTV